MMSLPSIGAATMPLQLKHTLPQQILAATILPTQQLATFSYFMSLLPQQLLEASIYFAATATISSCYFTATATFSSLYFTATETFRSCYFTAIATISSLYFSATAALFLGLQLCKV